MGVVIRDQSRVLPQASIRGVRRFPYQSIAETILRPEVSVEPTPSQPIKGEAPDSSVIGRRVRVLYQPSAIPMLPVTPAGIATDYNRAMVLPGAIGRRQRFLYSQPAFPELPQEGATPFDPTTGVVWQPTYPALHLRPRVPVALLLRTRPDTPWDIDISVPLWQPTYPDLHWRKVRVLWSASAQVTVLPEPDISPTHWLAIYADRIDPRRGLLAAHQMAFQYFLDAPNTLTDIQWFQPASLPSSTRMPMPRYYLQFATFDRDLTQGGDPTVVVIGEVWRRRNMKAPVGMLVRPILPGSE
jgi:hypothetical protein